MTKKYSSQPQSRSGRTGKSTAKNTESFSAILQPSLFFEALETVPGSMNDASVIRSAIVESIRKSGKSRETLADQMSSLTGTEITVRRLNAFAAESREDYRFPLELARAFCVATNNFSLLRRVVEMADLRLIDETEGDLLELGRETLRQKRANEKAALLERRLMGVDL